MRLTLDYLSKCKPIYDDGYLGMVNGEVGICAGIAMVCAIGFPPDKVCEGDLQYVMCMAEKDLDNLLRHKFYNFVGVLMRNNKDK